MSANDNLERRISDHFAAESPTRAPDWLLERAYAAVDATPQQRTLRRRPWRIPTRRSALATAGGTAVGAIAIVATSVIVLALLRQPAPGPAAPLSSASPHRSASPRPSATPRPSPAVGFSRFESALHGITIDYPSGWKVRPATEPWTTGKLVFDSPAADVLYDPALGDRLYIALASREGSGRSGQADEIDVWSDGGVDCSDGGGGSFSVDGAGAWDWHCDNGSSTVGVATDTRGFVIKLVVSSDEPGLRQTFNGDWLDTLLRDVDLRPEEAQDATGPSTAP